MQQFYCWSVS